jgi:putative ABC transport system permease protein
MSLWRQLTRGVRALANRSAADQDVADEVQHYLEQAAAAHLKRGLSPEEALRAARIELGNVTSVREEVRGYGWENLIETLFADLRYAARRLRAEPGFTAVAVLTLSLGIGGTTAIFSVVHPILFESLPYPGASRIAMIWELVPGGARNEGTFGMYSELAQRQHSFDAVAALKPWQPTMTGAEQPERFDGQRVSASYFGVFGVAPRLGRAFLPTEDQGNGPDVVVLSDGLWRRRFNGDRSIVGAKITLDDKHFTVIGVMPAGFENVLAPAAELWAPLQYHMAQGRAWGHHLRTVGRLRPGVSFERASQELTAVGRAVIQERHPVSYGHDVLFSALSLQEDLTRGVKSALLAVLGAVTLVLVIACVNVTNLLLARVVQRRGEFALRAALGAGTPRLIRQLLTESLLLAALGAVVGIAVAVFGVKALVALSPPDLPRLGAIGINGTVFAVAFGVTTLIGLAFGLAPALQAARSNPQQALQHGSPRTTGGQRRIRGALVIAEVALALTLLVSSGLLLRSLGRLFAVGVGFDSSDLLTMQVQTSAQRFGDIKSTQRFFTQALAAVQGVPGVMAAAVTSQLPMSGDVDLYGVHFDPRPSDDPGEVHGTFRYAVSPGYIDAMRIPLRSGRLINEHDGGEAPRVALISESIAKGRLVGLDPIGQRLQIGDGPLYTVVGVVGDVRQMSLALTESDAVYVPAAQWRFADNTMSFVIRGRGDPAALAPAIRQAIWSVDKDQPVVRVATMDQLLATSAAERRFALMLFEAFALAALVLAAAGIYGVVSGSVAERTREIGVRAALGASRGSILALVVRHGMTLTAFGVGIGLAGAAAASQVLATMLFGVSPLDPLTYFGVIALLTAVAIVACAVPAWRAARVDPAITLRTE